VLRFLDGRVVADERPAAPADAARLLAGEGVPA
jgi:hypothetical protein